MQTIKIIHNTGMEDIYETKQLNYSPHHNMISFDDVVVEIPVNAVAYVMNGAGSTIARYQHLEPVRSAQN